MRNLSRLIGFSFGLISVKSGFNRDDEWGYRACEPQRNVISSMALVLLKTGINHREDNKEGPPEIDPVQMGTAQKLLLFWRKPAVRMLSSSGCTKLFLDRIYGLHITQCEKKERLWLNNCAHDYTVWYLWSAYR